MKNSLKALALVLVSGGLLLTSCGDDTIYPSLNHENIEIKDDSKAFSKDVLDTLYEKIHDSSTNGQEVRDIIIANIAEQTVGTFKIINNEVKLVGYDIDENGKDVAKDKKLDFIQKHEAYWNKKQDDKKKYVPVKPDKIDESIENRIQVIKDIVETKIVEKLFDEANSDIYKEHNVFKEIKFARDKFKTSRIFANVDGKKVEFTYKAEKGKENIYDKKWEDEASTVFFNSKLIDSSVTKEDPTTIAGQMLHLDYYEDYINREILPSIVDTLLIEQYIYDNQYISLSRTQARKINYVSIQATEKTNAQAQILTNKFVTTKIEKGKPVNFDLLANAWKGVPGTEGYDLLKDCGTTFTAVNSHDAAIGVKETTGSDWYDKANVIKHFGNGEETPKVTEFYKETEFGQLMLDYAKINDNKHDIDSNAKQKEFSNSGAYGAATGLKYKADDIKVKDYTTTAWGTKDNGFGSLPSTIKDNLFQYSVANDVKVNPTQKDPNAEFEVNGYVVLYKGHYFLKTGETEGQPSIEDLIVHYDASSKTFYVVEILEALSQNKLMYGATTQEQYTDAQREKISREVGYTIASGDTYKNTAYMHYLEDCKLTYHDQSIYDFMKETYPDLFEEDK